MFKIVLAIDLFSVFKGFSIFLVLRLNNHKSNLTIFITTNFLNIFSSLSWKRNAGRLELAQWGTANFFYLNRISLRDKGFGFEIASRTSVENPALDFKLWTWVQKETSGLEILILKILKNLIFQKVPEFGDFDKWNLQKDEVPLHMCSNRIYVKFYLVI